ncbi:hypothetical protein GH714_021671 [Hevea brasiliensis]|uniref:Pentatricopeptide repeat-containing protein n=1 Tax=Hevea brasiliensis TaxID=3981 RepID=A0A6A6K6I9_HEVBR|nr:hypothetical protein GH714_021671 [Hevea brasiliensis]
MGFRPDHYTLPPLFKASVGVGDCYLGWMLHGWVIRLGFEGYVVVGSSVLDIYVKHGALVDAKRVFSNMLWKDSGVWNLMISGFGKNGFYAEALNLFRDMIAQGVKVDVLTIPSILNACGGGGDLMKVKEIHGQVVKSILFNEDVAIGNSLIDLYANVGAWVIQRSHSGLIDQGGVIFYSIWSDYGFEPCVEHCACMVDLLSRCGHLEEALGLAQNMKLAATASIWGALLAGCLMHKNVKIGEIAAHHLYKLEPRNPSNYVALSGMIHKFYQGDYSHPSTKVMCETLDDMIKDSAEWSEKRMLPNRNPGNVHVKT